MLEMVISSTPTPPPVLHEKWDTEGHFWLGNMYKIQPGSSKMLRRKQEQGENKYTWYGYSSTHEPFCRKRPSGMRSNDEREPAELSHCLRAVSGWSWHLQESKELMFGFSPRRSHAPKLAQADSPTAATEADEGGRHTQDWFHVRPHLPLSLEMLCLPRPSMQTHSCVFPAFAFSRELVSSFQRLLLKCINDTAEFTFVLCHLLQEGQGVCLSEFSRAVLTRHSAPPGSLQVLPGEHSGTRDTQHSQLHTTLGKIYIPCVISALVWSVITSSFCSSLWPFNLSHFVSDISNNPTLAFLTDTAITTQSSSWQDELYFASFL